MVTSTVYGAPGAPSGGPPARHTGTVIAGCLAIRPAPTEAEESAA